MPLVAEGLRPRKRLIHELPEKRLVAVHKFQIAEGGKHQIFLHLLDLPERRDGFAGRIIAQNGNAVIGAACAVVEILFAAEVGAPVGKELHILPLHLLPHRLPLRFRIVQRDFCENFLFARPGIQHVAGAVKL